MPLPVDLERGDVSYYDMLAKSLRTFLGTGETAQIIVAPVLPFNPTVPLIGAAKMVVSDSRAIVVTSERILVVQVAKNNPSGKVRSIVRSLPRSTRLGEPTGRIWKCESLGDPLWVYKKDFASIRKIDATSV